MPSNELLDTVFNMKFAIKQLNKCSANAEKASEKEKLNVKKALEKGNPGAARIYAENAIRKHNESLNYLRLSSRIDAASSRIQSSVQMQTVTKFMKNTVKGMDKVLESLDPMKIALVMDHFEKQVGTLDVNIGTMDTAFQNSEAGTVPVDQVDTLMEQIAVENNLDISEKMGGGPIRTRLSQPAAVEEEDDDIAERLQRLRMDLT